MPRNGQGGARTAPIGRPMPQRTDMNGPLPVSTATGQGYGVAAAQQAAQRSLPMGTQTVATGQGQPAQPAQPSVGPGDPSVALVRPTDRPSEPVTTGLPVGPGAGPEALPPMAQQANQPSIDQGSLATLLQSLANQPGATAAVRDLASRASGGVQ